MSHFKARRSNTNQSSITSETNNNLTDRPPITNKVIQAQHNGSSKLKDFLYSHSRPPVRRFSMVEVIDNQ